MDENVEYEERESEFDIEDEDKSEPEQTGNISQLQIVFPKGERIALFSIHILKICVENLFHHLFWKVTFLTEALTKDWHGHYY